MTSQTIQNTLKIGTVPESDGVYNKSTALVIGAADRVIPAIGARGNDKSTLSAIIVGTTVAAGLTVGASALGLPPILSVPITSVIAPMVSKPLLYAYDRISRSISSIF